MGLPDHESYCSEIVTQARLLGEVVEGAAPGTGVPTCPDWNLEQLMLHLGGQYRWVERIVRTRDQVEICAAHAGGSPEPTGQDSASLGAWLVEGAESLVDALRAAGPDAVVWNPVEEVEPSALSWARRMTHETLLHRADAGFAVGAEYLVEPEIAVDALDEWMLLCALPGLSRADPELRRLLGGGNTVHLHATDVPDELAAEWLVDLTGESITWRRAHERATVALRGSLTGLLLAVYLRKPLSDSDLEIVGDTGLLRGWLERVTVWFR
ncbi:TIGR03083 family protein [Actinopolyspora xinjiangensis]|uniref:TIGR03083 family protein n=1 Tax=Actinopolyspora xinjiangensis TaxID=405564 RepID=A0A1H0NM30_9ACTN|nr:maleylpyruvate isomerase family mycothiol-dependent enzyme [Actinopolyspora xinjiangensis]SDO93608.1 TIGR03083 family protein [Actinopolyspora xinjiangensis]